MSESNELYTLRDYLRWAISRFNQAGLFYGHGTLSATDEAFALILPSLHLPHDLSPHLYDARLTKTERDHLALLIERRIKERIPVPYLTHEAWFAGLSFYVDERVLIPRSPLAELIENQFTPWVIPDTVHHILDLCTGSGCIAIACAEFFPNAQIDASDISKEALNVAKTNVLRYELENQVHLHESNLFHALPPKHYDIIISNPPYVDATEMAALPQEFQHEPILGLAAGLKGLDYVEHILKEALHYLTPQGILVVEVGNSETALIKKYPNIPFTWLAFERGGGGVFLLTREQLQHI